jgi:outer membrane protein assembly factor BamB
VRGRVGVIVGVALLVIAAAPASAAAGDVVWSHSNHSNAVQAVDTDGSVVVSGASGGVEAVAVSDGSSEWSKSTGAADLEAVGGTVAVAEDSAADVVALDAQTGTQQWSNSLYSGESSAVGANATYVASGGEGGTDDNPVYLVDAATGNEVWSHTHHGGSSIGGVAIGGDAVVSFDTTDTVVAADPSDGSERWSSSALSNVNGITVSDDGATVYASDGQDLVALDIADGSERWRETIADSTITDVATNGSTVVASVDNGNLVAYNVSERRTEFTPSDGGNAKAAAVDQTHWYAGYSGGSVVAFDSDFSGTLVIRDEQNPDEIVADSTDISLEAVDGSAVTTTTVSDGTADLTALGNDPLIARADPDGWDKRSVIVADNTTTATVYVLNSSATTSTVTFELNDKTGRYGTSESRLYISRGLTRSGTTTYREVNSEEFEADGTITIDLERGADYRLRVENTDGDSRVLGGFSAQSDQRAVLEIGQFSFDVNSSARGYEWDARIENVSTNNGPRDKLVFEYADPSEATGTLDVVVYERDNESNEILNKTYTDLGSTRFTKQLSAQDRNKTWVAYINGTRGGQTISGQQIIGQTRLAPDVPLDPFYQQLVAVLILFTLAGVFGGVRAEAGAIVVAMTAGVLFYMSWLPNTVSAGMIVVALFVAVLYRIRSTPQPG